MALHPCPHCQQPVYTWRDRYLAGKWKVLRCGRCGERACAQPFVMMGLYFLYLWDVILFGALAILDQNWMYVGMMIGGWLILDYFSLYLPLSPLRRAQKS